MSLTGSACFINVSTTHVNHPKSEVAEIAFLSGFDGVAKVLVVERIGQDARIVAHAFVWSRKLNVTWAILIESQSAVTYPMHEER